MPTQSSFYTDGEIYDTAVVESNDVPASTDASNAPSSMYPGGNVYDEVKGDELLTEIAADLAAAQAAASAAASSQTSATSSQAAAAASAAAAAASATLAGTSFLQKSNNLSDLTSVATAKANLSLVKGDVGLGNVDNTSDANKPVSTAQATADALVASNAAAATALKANIASPALTGTPTATTATALDNSTRIATTAYADAAVSTLSGTTNTALALKAPLASPTLTGVPAAPTAAPGTNTTQLATTAFVDAARVILVAADALKANIASPALTGVPTAPTATALTNNTQLATTAYADAAVSTLSGTTNTALALKAPLASPALTGVPTAPTAGIGTNTTQIATTAFVLANASPVNVSPTPPGSAVDNSLWWESDTGKLYIRYNDGTSTQWVDAAPQPDISAYVEGLRKNYVINGAMQISQQNGTTAGTTAGYYPVDQFSTNNTNAGVLSAAQIASVSPAGSTNRIRLTVTTADAAVGAGDFSILSHNIEGLRIADLQHGTASAKSFVVRFGCKAPAGTYCVSITANLALRCYVAEYTISASEANTDVVKTITIPGDITGTWLKDNGIGLTIRWCFMAGSTFQQAAGSWTSSNCVGSANQFNFMGTNGNVFELFDVGLYAGTTAPTAYQVADYVSELALCKRYYRQVIPEGALVPSSTTQVLAAIRHDGMRATPTAGAVGTITVSDIFAANFTQSAASVGISSNSADWGLYMIPNLTGLTTSRPYLIQNAAAANQIKLDARL